MSCSANASDTAFICCKCLAGRLQAGHSVDIMHCYTLGCNTVHSVDLTVVTRSPAWLRPVRQQTGEDLRLAVIERAHQTLTCAYHLQWP